MAAKLIVITGPMFSKKSRRLIEALNDEAHADKKILLLKPVIDDRNEGVAYRKATLNPKQEEWEEFKAVAVSSERETEEIYRREHPDVIGIDEGHLFDIWMYDWIVKKLEEQKNNEDFMMVVAGLGTDYMRRPFKSMPDFMAIADEVVKLTAKCKKCKGKKGNAIYTERISGSARQIEVGSKNYQPVCRACHIIPVLTGTQSE